MENQQSWKMRFSYKNATILVCFFNVVTLALLLQGFLSAATTRKPGANQPDPGQMRHIMESEEIRRAMEPLDLIKRVKEIEQEVYTERETLAHIDPKQTAVDLSNRLKNFRANDANGQKALEEWRKRKMDRARQREIENNGTYIS